MKSVDAEILARPSLLARADRTGVPLLIARVLLGGMFVWMGCAKTGYPEMLLKKAGVWDSPRVQQMVKNAGGSQDGENSGFIELGGPVDFLKLIKQYEMIPDTFWLMLNFTAVAMPWVEALCGVLLIAGVGVRGAAGLLLVLLILFTTMIVLRGINIYRASDIAFCAIKFNCGCGGGNVWICHKIPENLTLTLLAIITLVSRSDRFCLRKNLLGAKKSESV